MLGSRIFIPSVIFFVVVLCTSAATKNAPQLQSQKPYSKSTIEATIRVLQVSYVDRASTLAIRYAFEAGQRARFKQGAFVDAVLHGLRFSRLIVTVEDVNKKIRPANQPRFYNVLFVDGYEAFRSIYMRMHDKHYDYTGLYTVVLTRSSYYQYETISRILNDCWRLHITNVIVLVAVHPRARTAIYTYFPYTSFHCEEVRPVILDYYLANGRFLYESTDFFPPKARNLYGCALHVGVFHVMPYVWVTAKTGLLNGFDGTIVLSMADQLNFTIVVHEEAGDRRGGGTGVIYANGTGTGVIGMLLRNEVNVSVGALEFRRERQSVLSPSVPYFQEAVVLAVPMGRSYSSIEKLFLPYNRSLWIRMAVIFGGAGVIFLLLQFRRCSGALAFVAGANNRTPFVNMAAVLLGASLMRKMPVRNFARYVLMVWMLGSLVFRTAYQAALFHIVQSPMKAAPIDRLDDLLTADYTLRMPPERFVLFDDVEKAKPHLRATEFINNTLEFDELIHRPTYRDAYITLSMIAGFYNQRHIDQTVHVASERLFTVSMCMYFRKHSCITTAFNEQLENYVVNGLLKTWSQRFVDWETIRLATEEDRNDVHHRPLRMDEVMGVFQICALCLVMSSLVFVLEVLSVRSVLLARFFRGLA